MELNYEKCHELFEIDKGCLIRRVDTKGTAKAGTMAGTLNNGYLHVRVDGSRAYVHQVIFFMTHGYIPAYIDHIDGNKLNNRPENLRESTSSKNACNALKKAGGSSQYKGVSWDKKRCMWRAGIKVNGKSFNLGDYKCESKAAEMVDKATRGSYGEHGTYNFPREGERSCLRN